MGWNGENQPRHINEVINEQLHVRRAADAHVSRESVDCYRQSLAQVHELQKYLYSLIVKPIQV